MCHHSVRNDPPLPIFRYLREIADGRITLYLDESGFNLWMRPRYGRARRGQRVRSQVPPNRGCNMTLLLVISPQFGVFLL